MIPALICIAIGIVGFLWVCRIEDRENERFMEMMRARFGNDLED